LLVFAACTNARQVVLEIDTTAGVPCDIDSIRIVAKAAGTTTIDQSLKGARLPISVTLLDDTPHGSFMVDVFGLKGNVEVMHTGGPLRFSDHKVTQAVLLEPKCTANTPCALSNTTLSGMGLAGARLQCGANVTRYRAEPAQDMFVDACLETDPGARVGQVFMDRTRVPVRLTDLEDMLPNFGFQFYGRALRQIWVAKDGYISFAQDSPDPINVLVPGPLDRDIKHTGEPPPTQSIMAFWDSLILGAQGVCYELKGQQLRMTWEHACLVHEVEQPCPSADSTNNLNFTITLDASNQRVVLTYGTMSAGNRDRQQGATATVGLVNDATGCPVEECALATGLCQDGVTPCGYSQVFSNTVQMPGVQSIQFTPIVDP
jgi:hypothetical protein